MVSAAGLTGDMLIYMHCLHLSLTLLCVLVHTCFAHRCYEVRCASGVVPRNTSGVPYPLQDANVPYNWSRVGSAALMDKYSRPFPGNSLAANDEIFTQCWNATDQPAGQVIILQQAVSHSARMLIGCLTSDSTHFAADAGAAAWYWTW